MNISTETWVTGLKKVKTSYSEHLNWRGGTYRIQLNTSKSTNDPIPREIDHWVRENICASCRLTNQGIFTVKFRRKVDFMAFKLRWYRK